MVNRYFFLFIGLASIFWPGSPVAAAPVLQLHEFAWSDNVGYINFGKTTVGDTALGGSAWSENKGFIVFTTDEGGVTNDGFGNLTGSAWGQQLGWIDFSQVRIDQDGNFHGVATGELVGTITFDCPKYCDVQTAWRPRTATNSAVVAPVDDGSSVPEANSPTANINSGETVVPPSSVPPGELALFDVVTEPGPTGRVSTTGFWTVVLMIELLLLAGIIFLIWWLRRRRRNRPLNNSVPPLSKKPLPPAQRKPKKS